MILAHIYSNENPPIHMSIFTQINKKFQSNVNKNNCPEIWTLFREKKNHSRIELKQLRKTVKS